MYFIFFSALVLAVVVFGAVSLGSHAFQRHVLSDVNTLLSTSVGVGPHQLNARGDLPEPVRRYLSYAISKDAPATGTVHLKHDGYFRTSPDQKWFPISGEEYFTTGKPGFVWRATIYPIPLLSITARDRLTSGQGNMLVKFLSTFSIADASGPEIDQGAMLRWLAEAAWFPYAFVGDGITWEPIDANSARASLHTCGAPVTAVFGFDNEGKLSTMRALRYRDMGREKAELTNWTGHYAEYKEINGFRVPTSVEVAWELKSGLFTYARFHITALDYNITTRRK